MRWRGHRESKNVEDRRGMSTSGKVFAGGGIGAIIIALLSMFLGVDLSGLIGTDIGTQSNAPQQVEQRADEMDKFVKVILASTEDVWHPIFRKELQMNYREPKLNLFTHSVQSACGGASAAMGPFYCPADEKVYIDLSFCDQLRNQFKVEGEFAVAYVVAHEVGHHIQNLLGIAAKVQSQRGRISEAEYNKLSVKMELQADFLAGVWAHYAQAKNKWLDPADLASALAAANAIGDDRLQKQSQGYVVPESFTHGTSQQRMYWFKLGFESGDLNRGNFNNIK